MRDEGHLALLLGGSQGLVPFSLPAVLRGGSDLGLGSRGTRRRLRRGGSLGWARFRLGGCGWSGRARHHRYDRESDGGLNKRADSQRWCLQNAPVYVRADLPKKKRVLAKQCQ